MKSRVETIGWLGTSLILTSYALMSLDIIDNNSLIYHSIVAIGAAALVLVTYRQHSFQTLVVNSVFGVLSIIAIIRILLF